MADAEDPDYEAPFEPIELPGDKEAIRRYCQSPVSGRLEWIQAEIYPKHLHSGTDLTEEMEDYLFESVDMGERDEPSMIIHKSIGGRGDVFWNIFPMGTTFDVDTYDDEVESTVFHAVKTTDRPATVTVRFLFKTPEHTKPYKLLYRVELPTGDYIENELINA
mmetsp:Transcript_7089/g.12732  ORF Transcript_7089/g.12732 Transcript_7089/m.12732 type:complete len:163 (-) Transcript_7089:1273-1761(-)|eukprot:CAMPEP_0182441294 /NCGR_PEP_ID=MMETSP1172-20130603/225_1 /TAXON_ID=708627 /ORGANISM="Timspurckia oligopyrenoides, Strain CCMP3278" /LENGTH=162 /DNA_ID=CAMNT_0024635477 /DNA_START=127 /DNA_END=615 /DNA_ORIENTATION=+